MLPDLDGFEVCRRLRAEGDRTPVLFLTARDATEDKVRGLTLGGDDYLQKPFSLEELERRSVAPRSGGAGVNGSRSTRCRPQPHVGSPRRGIHRAEESQDRLQRFVADASHELRTPVTSIRGYAELYRVGGLAERNDLDEAMRRTEQAAVRMARLVDDLLSLAKLDQGRQLEHRPVDLSRLVGDAVRDAAAVDPSRTINADLNGPVTVSGDEDRLRQVIANIVETRSCTRRVLRRST